MNSLPTWAVWGFVVPLVLLSPVTAFLLALAAEAMGVAVHMRRFRWGWCSGLAREAVPAPQAKKGIGLPVRRRLLN
jgi:hypothetical protein